MDWETKDIRSDYHGIVKDSLNLNEGELSQKYLNFKTTFPKLFKMAIESVETSSVQKSLELFEMMLNRRQSQKDGETNKINTDMSVGNQLGKEFIYPKTGGPDQQGYSRAVQKIQKGEALKELGET